MSRRISFRYELLRGGAYCALLKAVSRTPRIRANSADRLKMLLTGQFAPWARDVDGRPVEIDWLSDEIRPVMIIDGNEYPLGVFVPVRPEESRSGPVTTVSLSAYDRTQKVADMNSASLLYWPAGTPYLDAVEQLLSASGINTVFKTPSAATFAEAREDWELGTPFLDAANKLLSEINYNPLWFNQDGAAVLEPASVPEASAIEHVLDTNDKDTRVIGGSFTRTRDLFNAPNVFVVVCQNPEKGAPMTATATNENPQSPLSVPRRGRQIVSVTRVDNIPDQAALDAYAARLCAQSMITGETIKVETGLLPGWGVADVVALNYEGETSICISRSWDMELKAGGRMVHTLEKVVYNLDD